MAMAFDPNKPADSAPLVSVDVRNNLLHVKNAFLKEHNWLDSDPNASTHKLNVINATVSGSTQRDTASGYDYTTGSGNITGYIHHVVNGATAGTYTVQALLQELVNKSHNHVVERRLSNCNCDCGDGE
jgi:hypothetical protein